MGAASAGLFKRYTVGSVANALLHACNGPSRLLRAALNNPTPTARRLTPAVGQRAGAEAANETAIRAAKRRGVPLRLVSLVELDAAGAAGEAINVAHIHANTVLDGRIGKVPAGHEVGVAVAHVLTIEEAIEGS